MILEEKYKKVMELYPDTYLTEMMVAGGSVAASGTYTSDELTDMFYETFGVLAQVMIDKIKNFGEALLLMSGLTREFMEKGLDLILNREINMIEKYEHHGNEVFVRSELKGKHREHCLCYNCGAFSEKRTSNCSISNVIYAICVGFGLVLPVWECPKFKEIGGE